jgi:uncharacterized SAM-binding protein YcdF (DUF218 family)
MLVSQLKEEQLTAETVDRLLFQGIEDTGEAADCIIVLGSMKAVKYRLPAALEAYKSGRAKKMILCGGKIREFPDGMRSEAEEMKKSALKMGISEEDIILENRSMHTVDNIRFALEEIKCIFPRDSVRRVLLVTTTYHMRRSLAIARHVFPENVTVIPCPADDTSTRRDNWMNTSEGIARANGEARKIVQYVINGFIPDFEV